MQKISLVRYLFSTMKRHFDETDKVQEIKVKENDAGYEQEKEQVECSGIRRRNSITRQLTDNAAKVKRPKVLGGRTKDTVHSKGKDKAGIENQQGTHSLIGYNEKIKEEINK